MAEETSPGVADAPEVDEVQPVEGEAIEQEVQLDENGNPVEPEPEPEPEDDTDEIEKDGEKYRIPKALKDNFLMHKDYTFKTQALAEEKQKVATTLQHVETALQQARTVSNEEVQAAARIISIDNQLAEFQQIDWQTWNQTNPQAAQAAFMEYTGVKDARQAAVNAYGQAVQQRTAAEQLAQQQRTELAKQETENRIRQAQAELARDIPGWNQDKADALLNFGRNHYGFTKQELESFDDPRIVRALNDALSHVQATTKSKAAQKVQTQQKVTPAAKVTGAAAPIRPLDDRASTDAWMKARMKQKQASSR